MKPKNKPRHKQQNHPQNHKSSPPAKGPLCQGRVQGARGFRGTTRRVQTVVCLRVLMCHSVVMCHPKHGQQGLPLHPFPTLRHNLKNKPRPPFGGTPPYQGDKSSPPAKASTSRRGEGFRGAWLCAIPNTGGHKACPYILPVFPCHLVFVFFQNIFQKRVETIITLGKLHRVQSCIFEINGVY